MERNNWQRKTIIFGFIAIESLLLAIGITKPALSSYFGLPSYYKNGFKKSQLGSKFKVSDRISKRKIAITKIENFRTNILYNEKYTLEAIYLLDSIVFKNKIEFARFKYNLTANNLDFYVRTRKNKLNSLINSVSSHWQINLKKELDNFSSDRQNIASINSEATEKTWVSSTASWEVDSLIIIFILSVILFRVNQQIHNKPQLNRESPELNLSKHKSSEDRLFK